MLNYQLQYPQNIKTIFLENNSGFPGKPRNEGMKYVTSDYILFLDADDYYLKDALELLYHTITKYNSDIVIGCYYINEKGHKKLSITDMDNNIINMDPLKNQNNFDKLCVINSCTAWSKIYKKEFIFNNNLKFIEDANAEDVHFYINILKHSAKVTVLPQNVVYNYEIYDDSTIHDYDLDLFNHILLGAHYTIEILKQLELKTDRVLFEIIGVLLLVFFNLKNNLKKDAALKIYKIEKYLEKKFNFHMKSTRIEVNLLNKTIMEKKFKKAIFISNIYKIAYSNKIIKKIYQNIRKE